MFCRLQYHIGYWRFLDTAFNRWIHCIHILLPLPKCPSNYTVHCAAPQLNEADCTLVKLHCTNVSLRLCSSTVGLTNNQTPKTGSPQFEFSSPVFQNPNNPFFLISKFLNDKYYVQKTFSDEKDSKIRSEIQQHRSFFDPTFRRFVSVEVCFLHTPIRKWHRYFQNLANLHNFLL